MIVSLVLDVPEASSTEAMELQAQLSPFLVRNDVNVGFLADADLIAERVD